MNSVPSSISTQVLKLAIEAAAQYRDQFSTTDAVTIITTDGVKTLPVVEAMQTIMRGISTDEGKLQHWNSNIERLRNDVLSDDSYYWFGAIRQDKFLDVWKLPASATPPQDHLALDIE